MMHMPAVTAVVGLAWAFAGAAGAPAGGSSSSPLCAGRDVAGQPRPTQRPFKVLCGESAPAEDRRPMHLYQAATHVDEPGGACTSRHNAEVWHECIEDDPPTCPLIRHRAGYGGLPGTTWESDTIRALVVSSPKMGTGGIVNTVWTARTTKDSVTWLLRTHEVGVVVGGFVPFPNGYAKPPNGRCVVVTPFREPMSWLLSLYFQQGRRPTPGHPPLCEGPVDGVDEEREFLTWVEKEAQVDLAYATSHVLDALGVTDTEAAMRAAIARSGVLHLTCGGGDDPALMKPESVAPVFRGCELILLQVEKLREFGAQERLAAVIPGIEQESAKEASDHTRSNLCPKSAGLYARLKETRLPDKMLNALRELPGAKGFRAALSVYGSGGGSSSSSSGGGSSKSGADSGAKGDDIVGWDGR